MLEIMSNLAKIVYYIFTSWIAGSIAIMALAGAWMVWKDWRYSQHLKKTARHRNDTKEAKDVARFEKELEAYEASTEPDGYGNEFFTNIVDLIETDPVYKSFAGSQDLSQIYYPNHTYGTQEVDDYFTDPELEVDHPNDWFFASVGNEWTPSAWKPQYTQAELDRMFHEEYTQVAESRPDNPAIDLTKMFKPQRVSTASQGEMLAKWRAFKEEREAAGMEEPVNAFQAIQEKEGFYEELEERLNVNGGPDEEDR